jgi:hypothetical protein
MSVTHTYSSIPYPYALHFAGEGVVVGPAATAGWISITWDKGGTYSYRYGAQGALDVEEVPPTGNVRTFTLYECINTSIFINVYICVCVLLML